MINMYGISENGAEQLIDSASIEGLTTSVGGLIESMIDDVNKGWWTFEKYKIVDHKGNVIKFH